MTTSLEDLLKRCRDLFIACDQFNSHEDLQTVFAADLETFKGGLPEATNRRSRVSQTLDYLLPRRLRDQRPALVLFIRALQALHEAGDDLQAQLAELATEVEQELSKHLPLHEGEQPLALIFLPEEQRNTKMAKIILAAVDEIGYQPIFDCPRGAGNLDNAEKAAVVIADITAHDSNLLFSLGIIMALRDGVVLLFGGQQDRLPHAVSVEECVRYSYEMLDADVQAKIVEALRIYTSPHSGVKKASLVQKALRKEIRNLLCDPQRFIAPEAEGQRLFDQMRAEFLQRDTTLATLNEQLEQLQAHITTLHQPRQVDTTLQQVHDLRSRLNDMIAKHQDAELQTEKAREFLQHLVRDREAVIRQVRVVAHTLEAQRMLIKSERDGAWQVFVPAALFAPGPPRANEAERRQAERFVKALYLDVTPVTNDQFAAFVRATGYSTVRERLGVAHEGFWRQPEGPGSSLAGRDDHPVVWVYREDALAYATWAERRLPTCLEWERALRGVAGHPWPWGAQFDPTRCNLAGYGTTPVTAYPAGESPCGCLDMIGNVWEWLADELPGKRLVLMGGAWNKPLENLPVGYGGIAHPGDVASASIGFRCALDVAESQ